MNHLIEYTGANFHYVNFDGKEIAGKFIEGGSKMFYPGINMISDEEWAKVKANPLSQHLFEDGQLVWVNGAPGDKDSKPKKLSEMTPVEAKKIVAKTVKSEILTEWLALEKRADVITALKIQMNKINPDAEGTEEQ